MYLDLDMDGIAIEDVPLAFGNQASTEKPGETDEKRS